jgi:LysM repeat protein
MVTRNRGRYLAPIAILVVITATVLIVQAELSSKRHARRRAGNIGALARHPRATAAAFYVVKSGDSLSRISVKTGVSVPRLETLNPGVDPAALQTGQRLRLRR